MSSCTVASTMPAMQSPQTFDAEDRRLLEGLSAFAASAYRALAKAGALDSLLSMRPAERGTY
jgi:hypothetical protein